MLKNLMSEFITDFTFIKLNIYPVNLTPYSKLRIMIGVRISLIHVQIFNQFCKT